MAKQERGFYRGAGKMGGVFSIYSLSRHSFPVVERASGFQRREREAFLKMNPLVKCRHCDHLVANSDDQWITCPKCCGKNEAVGGKA